MRQIFVVGCARSGTTFVQALLARYPGVYSFPETALFEAVLGGVERRWGDSFPRRDRRWYHRMGFAQTWGRRRLRELELILLANPRRARPYLASACIRRGLVLLDRAATENGCDVWVEKTPNHVVYVEDISQHAPHAFFVHVLRNGEDVVASVIDADIQYNATAAFGGGVKFWAQRWNRAVNSQLGYLGTERHHFLCFEDLIENFDATWSRLCAFLDFDVNASLFAQPKGVIADVSAEPWKRDALDGIARKPVNKSASVFGPRTRDWLRANLTSYAEIRAKIAQSH